MSRVFWDTNIFIYFFEHRGAEGRECTRLFVTRMLRRGDQLITSAMTVGEILVKPRQRQDLELCRQYEQAITATALVLPFDLAAARRFSELRLNRTLRAPDAIQLSCAATVDTDLFITNDSRLSDLKDRWGTVHRVSRPNPFLTTGRTSEPLSS
jgi:predicted nucleic acid-binding protein